MDPEKVIEPTKTDTTIEMSSTTPLPASPAPAAVGKIATPRATNNDDMPPQPLNRATVSGMEVIGTRCAVIAPRHPPTTVPKMIQIQASAAMPVVPR